MKLHSFLFFTLLGLTLASCQKNENQVKEIIPLAPTDLTAKLIAPTQIQLNWIDKSTNEKGFCIQRKTGNGNFTLLDSVGLDISTYTDKNILLGQTYTYRVVSFNSAGIAITYSNEVTIATISLPVLQTMAISDTTGVSAIAGGQITSDGGSPITARGVVWGTSSNPEITLATKTIDGAGTGTFASKLSALKTNTKYYVRAYATNLAGTAYGQEVSFTTPSWDLETGLMAYFPFNGNANDESGNGNNGIVSGAILTTDRLGNAGKAYSFNGLDAFIKVLVSPSLIIQNNISISAWVYRLNGGSLNPEGILGPATYLPTTPGYYLRVIDNMADLAVSYPYTEGFSNSFISGGQWTHIVGVYNNNSMQIFINGKLDKETVVGSNRLGNWTSSYFFTIGQERDYRSTNLHPWNGYLDEIRVYNRVLSQSEVSFLANH